MIAREPSAFQHPAPPRPSGGHEQTIHRVWKALRAALPGSDHAWFIINLPVTASLPEDWLAGFEGHSCVLWAPKDDDILCGLGVAVAFTSTGSQRFEAIGKQAEELWAQTAVLTTDELSPPWQPRLFGGFAFSDCGSVAPEWKAFGAARFFLPRLTYVKRRDKSLLSVAFQRSEIAETPEGETLDLLRRALAQIDRKKGLGWDARSKTAQVVQSSEEGTGSYAERVADIVQLIGQGKVDKIVTAREVCLRSTQPIDALATAFALRTQAPHCLRFVFRFGEHSFLGATPEMLVRRQGRRIVTEALAGTIAGDLELAEQRLAASAKDLQEHKWVVEAIDEVLAPLCLPMDKINAPQVRKLRHLLHLCTPIEAELREDIHVLSLVELLHPSPAVGGVPSSRARTWIEQHEPFDRGWYSGVVGWFNRLGDGAFNVALRSGLADAEGIRLYAGAGVVKDSIPAAEFEETTLKLTSLRSALRCSVGTGHSDRDPKSSPE